MKILGISAFYHDSAAAIIHDEKILAAAQEERFTRKKHDASFPANAIQYCLEFAGFSINELDAVVFYDKPLLKFERLLETYYGFAPKGISSFITSMPVWLKEKLFLKKQIYDGLKEIGDYDKKELKLLFPEHHLSHAASAFYPSPFQKAAILTIDGVGEWSTASICLGEGNRITVLKELHFPHSLGLLYSAFTYFLGFKVNNGEYKLMGMAPYGNEKSANFEKYISIIKKELVDIKEDGSIWLNQSYFKYATGLRMVYDKKWEKLFGFPRRELDSEVEQFHCDLALAIQRITEEVVFKMAIEAKRITGADYLCLAGGVALNCVSNGKLLDHNPFKDIFIQPAAGDAGGALGAALAANYISFEQERNAKEETMQSSLLGPSFENFEIKKALKKHKVIYKEFVNEVELFEKTAQLLAKENVIGWFQGRMEFGPRALGNRSILGDPRSIKMQEIINLKIKFRESFRPFAPSVLEEDCAEYFDFDGKSPYMLLVRPVKKSQLFPIPANYHDLSMKEKLATVRSKLQAITHVDNSARIQTVSEETNARYAKLLKAFKNLTSCSTLINTSFNVRGEPIVCTPEDAFNCFMNTNMDYLVIGNLILDKKEQL